MKNKYLVFRLKPGDDLLQKIIENCVKKHLNSAAIISAVGCVKEARFRKADGKTVHQEIKDFEVTSLSGTISNDGPHIHIQLCDNKLRSIGGHLTTGTIVNTTMEIVLLNLENEYRLTREFDESTGYDELVVKKI